MYRMSRVALAILVLLAVALPTFAEDGPALFKAKCAACHAPDGTGSAIGKKMGAKPLGSAETQKLSDADLEKVITGGKGKMPAVKNLSPEQIKSLVVEIRAFGKK